MFSVRVVMVPSACLVCSDVAVPQQCNEFQGSRGVLWDHAFEIGEDDVEQIFSRVVNEFGDSDEHFVQVHFGCV